MDQNPNPTILSERKQAYKPTSGPVSFWDQNQGKQTAKLNIAFFQVWTGLKAKNLCSSYRHITKNSRKKEQKYVKLN